VIWLVPLLSGLFVLDGLRRWETAREGRACASAAH